ncbi:hypothetical protein evm_009176 [Chilo suppressalis]|nr:hypothetical protein evm_009176 [Chilo suppressalis]
MGGIERLGHDPPHGPSENQWMLTTADAAATNDSTYPYEPKRSRYHIFLVTHPMTSHFEMPLGRRLPPTRPAQRQPRYTTRIYIVPLGAACRRRDQRHWRDHDHPQGARPPNDNPGMQVVQRHGNTFYINANTVNFYDDHFEVMDSDGDSVDYDYEF